MDNKKSCEDIIKSASTHFKSAHKKATIKKMLCDYADWLLYDKKCTLKSKRCKLVDKVINKLLDDNELDSSMFKTMKNYIHKQPKVEDRTTHHKICDRIFHDTLDDIDLDLNKNLKSTERNKLSKFKNLNKRCTNAKTELENDYKNYHRKITCEVLDKCKNELDIDFLK